MSNMSDVQYDDAMVDDSPSQEVLVRSFMQECHIKALGSCLSQWRRRALTSHISMVRASQVAHTLCEKAAALSSCTSYQSGYIHRLHRVHPYVAITANASTQTTEDNQQWVFWEPPAGAVVDGGYAQPHCDLRSPCGWEKWRDTDQWVWWCWCPSPNIYSSDSE